MSSPSSGHAISTGLVLTALIVSASARASEAIKRIDLTDQQVARMEIKVAPVQPTDEQPLTTLPGTVVPAHNARIVAAAPFGGTVLQVYALPGQMVHKGDPLVTISSRELLDAISAKAQAEAELQMAEATARRRRSLADKNIQNPTMADEAEAQVAKIKAVIEQHARLLTMGGIVAGEGGSYTLPAPADGRIVSNDVMPGDKIDQLNAAVTLDTSNDLWIEVQVPASLVMRIRKGDKVHIVDGPEGQVVSVGGSLDKMTRSAKLLATVPAQSGLLPGQMVTVSLVQQAETGSLAIPSTAVARINERDGVFVRDGAGFNLIPVKVNGRSQSSATIVGNVPLDAQVAASGLPQLEQLLSDQ